MWLNFWDPTHNLTVGIYLFQLCLKHCKNLSTCNGNNYKRKKEEKKQIYQELKPEIINIGSNLGKSPLLFPRIQTFKSGEAQGPRNQYQDEKLLNSPCLVSRMTEDMRPADPSRREVNDTDGS